MFWQQWMKSNFGNWQTLKIIFLGGNNIPSLFVLDTCFFASYIHLSAENLVSEHEATKIGRIPFPCKSLQYFVFFCLFIVLKAFSRHGAWIMCKNGGSNDDSLYFSFNPLTPSSGNSLYPSSFLLHGYALIIWVFSTG